MSASAGTPPMDAPVSILIVDDNAAKRMALRAVLRPLGHRLVEADSGVAALRCLMDDDFAVILLDVRMPIMDGFQTASLVRQRERSELTPIIFVTAYRSDELLTTERYAEGAVDFMYAPVDPVELRSKVTVLSKIFARNDKVAAQSALLGSGAEQLTQLIDVAPIGIFRADVDGRIVYANSCWADITGVSAAAAVGREWTELVAAEEGLQLQCEPSEADPRLEVTRPDRPPASYSVSTRAIETRQGAATGYISIVAALSSLPAGQVQRTATQIVAMSDHLLATGLNKSQRQQVAAIRRSGDALAAGRAPLVKHEGAMSTPEDTTHQDVGSVRHE